MVDEELERLWSDPSNWSAWGVYYCAADPRIVVPKQSRWVGWTINFARRGSILLLLGLVSLGGVPAIAAVLAGIEDPLVLTAIIVASGLAVVAVTLAADRRGRGLPLFPSMPKWGHLQRSLRNIVSSCELGSGS